MRARWAVLGLTSILGFLSGCPGDDGDDDSAIGDDDDDDAVADASEITVTAAAECAPLQSVFWKDYDRSADYPLTLVASTQSDYCTLTRTYEEAQREASDAHSPAYIAAQLAEDGPASCQALLAYYGGFLSAMADLWPAGSCAASVTLDRAQPGSYGIGADVDGATLTASYSQGMDAEGILAMFDGCQSVESWEDWLALSPVVSAALQFDGEIWSGQSGNVVLVVGEADVFGAEGTNLAIVENFSGEPGTLTCTLVAPPCELPGSSI